ncbi:MAG: DUF1385 domain-containing protein [Oscillospiraceae bacterium]|nr:DUF1385 domain-containing protein [Oscillospiraceae bacterium]
MTEKKDFRTSIGGQALIEGIMMRGPKKQAVVVRTKDGIESKVDDLKLLKDRYPVVGWPLIRGVVNFGGSMINGVRALMYSASLTPEEEAEPESKFDKWVTEKLGSEKAEGVIVTITVVLGIALSIGLFMLLPTFLAGFVTKFVDSAILKNLIEGVLRIVIFVAYIALTSRIPDMRRVWQYHGAEHKTIFCYERGLPLTVENVREMPRKHPRCGTSFMFIVMIVSILVFSLARWHTVWARMGLRLLLLPVVVAVSYEIIKWAGRHDNWLTRIVSAPGRALQNLTTREPDDEMIEVAIESIRLVLPEEEGADAW